MKPKLLNVAWVGFVTAACVHLVIANDGPSLIVFPTTSSLASNEGSSVTGITQSILFYVSRSGRDDNPGTESAPFATLIQARNAVRSRIAVGLKGDVIVWIRGGTYELTEPLVLGPEDSGTAEHSITYAEYADEKVIISGGRPITGWQHGQGKLWKAHLPEVARGNWYFRQLFVNGQHAIRARSPNIDDKVPFYQLTGSLLSNDLKTWALKLGPGQVVNWKCPSDVEIVVLGPWEITRKRLQSTNPATDTVVLASPHLRGHSQIQPRSGMYCYFENALAMLDRPLEWYLDRQNGVLCYMPLPGQEMMRSEVVAPLLTQLLQVKGEPARLVRNLHFKGLQFSYTTWEMPETGYPGIQACFYDLKNHEEGVWGRVPEAICWEYADGCSMENGEISHLGGTGLSLRQGCSSNLIEGNLMFDIAGNGITVGEGVDSTNTVEAVVGNQVANNNIHHCGMDYYGAVGVWVGFTDGTVVSHNLVHDLPYTGISVGWRWDALPTGCKANVIEYNHVHDVAKLLCDAGGIYMLGFQPGTTLRGNWVHNLPHSPYSGGGQVNGFFIDNGSKGFIFEGNVGYAIPDGAIRVATNPDDFTWNTNSFETATPNGTMPRIGESLTPDGIERVEAKAGLEPPYRKHLLPTK